MRYSGVPKGRVDIHIYSDLFHFTNTFKAVNCYIYLKENIRQVANIHNFNR